MEKFNEEIEKMKTVMETNFSNISISQELFMIDITLMIKNGEDFKEVIERVISLFFDTVNHVKKWMLYIGISYECDAFYFIHDWTYIREDADDWIWKSPNFLNMDEMKKCIKENENLNICTCSMDLTCLHLKFT